MALEEACLDPWLILIVWGLEPEADVGRAVHPNVER